MWALSIISCAVQVGGEGTRLERGMVDPGLCRHCVLPFIDPVLPFIDSFLSVWFSCVILRIKEGCQIV